MRKRVMNTLSIITEIYIFFIVILFPLMVDSTGFFKILEYKWKIYSMASFTYIFIILVYILYS